MNPDGTFYVCEYCREPVEADAPGIVRAHELIRTANFSGTDDVIEGMGVFFHERHYPVGSRRYRRAVAPPP